MASKIDAYDFSKSCYTEYGQYVNTHRAFPRAEDGLKVVQRLLMYTTTRMADKNQKCASIVGDCMSHYHPHASEAMYSALVKLINSENSPYVGQGNFGSNVGLIRTGAAAQRYTGAKLSDFGKEFLKFVRFSDFYENDLGNQEPVYIPTPIPFAMMNGDNGIGVGAVTNITAFTSKSLKEAVKSILKGDKKIPDLIPHVENGIVDITTEEVRAINDTGYGSFSVKSIINTEWSDEDKKNVLVVSGLPDRISPDRIFAAFREEIEKDEIEIRDESSDKTRILLVRKPKLKNFTEDILREKLERATSKRINTNMQVSFGDHVRRVSPKEWLQYSLDRVLTAYEKYLDNEIYKYSLEIKFHQVKKQLAELLQQDAEDDVIMEKLKLTKDEFSNFASRSLRQLRKDKDIEALIKERDELLSKKANRNASYLKDHFSVYERLLTA